MTRRDVLMFPAVLFGPEMRQGDTTIRVLDAGDGTFMVGVQSDIGDQALVQVLYRKLVPELSKTPLYLSEESIAPVVREVGMGLTRRNFSIPKDQVAFIRVTLFKTLGEREFGKEAK